MEAIQVSLRARSVSTGGLLRPCLPALLFLLAACASGPDVPHAEGFHTHWEILIPVRDYLYLGDNLPECTDARANVMAYRRDHTLLICTGGQHGDGWLPLVIGEEAP